MKTRISIDDYLDRIGDLHSSPEVALRAVKILQDEDFDVSEVSLCLQSDPALSESILRLVNSSYYGLTKQVASLDQAIALLGVRTLRLTVLSFGILDSMSRGTPRELYRAFWKRAITIASASSILAESSSEVPRESAFTGGLLSDLGVLLMAQSAKSEYPDLHNSHEHGTDLEHAEYERFGFTHADFGARLLQRWNLPDELVQAVANHHDGVSDQPLSNVVYVANALSDILWTPFSGKLPHTQELLRDHFEIDLDGFIDLVMSCKEKVDATAQLFQVDTSSSDMDTDTLLSRARELYVRSAVEATIELDGLMDLANGF